MNYIVLTLTGGRLRSLHVTEESLARTMAQDGSLTEAEALRRIAAGATGAEKVWVLDRASLPLGGAYPEAYVYTGDDAAPLAYYLERLRARRRREFAERREAEESAGFVFEGLRIPSDLAARLDLSTLPERAAAAGKLDWKAGDAVWMTLDVVRARGLRGALWAHLAACAAREKAADAALAALDDADAIISWDAAPSPDEDGAAIAFPRLTDRRARPGAAVAPARGKIAASPACRILDSWGPRPYLRRALALVPIESQRRPAGQARHPRRTRPGQVDPLPGRRLGPALRYEPRRGPPQVV